MGGAAERFSARNTSRFVSIAGAILWGVLLIARIGKAAGVQVSIAGAILWGVLPR